MTWLVLPIKTLFVYLFVCLFVCLEKTGFEPAVFEPINKRFISPVKTFLKKLLL
jgi:hypothetical protein